ncbi:MAG TPA: 1-deoxy-D-xylulose-5-phosphate reductoisomerase [Dehalococcoidia bacterium]|nr:1-deoxy-D-xylulose-5-phosphate reductoisomerase [Dehalococcoidia bacterium]
MVDSVKRVAVLGSTGSIGRQTVDVIRAMPQQFQVVGLAAGKNLELLAEQIKEFKPEFIGCPPEENDIDRLKDLVNIKNNLLSLDEIAASKKIDIVVIATSGKAGLGPTLAALRAGKNIALANKEALVSAGEIITEEASRSGARILPVDSEHSAIWQCLSGEHQEAARIILTASGGPFRQFSREQLEKVTVSQALQHPSWRMGKKVTVDSATLMNKGLEVIEAHWLFHMPYERIDVLVHPQSIIHSMVEFVDGSIKAQLSYPDMRLPIQYALSYPERLANPQLPRVDWGLVRSLEFELPDYVRFPCLRLAIEAGRRGGTYPAVLCAADEVAVELFLTGRIQFTDIAGAIERTLEQHRAISSPGLGEIEAADVWARETLLKTVGGVR